MFGIFFSNGKHASFRNDRSLMTGIISIIFIHLVKVGRTEIRETDRQTGGWAEIGSEKGGREKAKEIFAAPTSMRTFWSQSIFTPFLPKKKVRRKDELRPVDGCGIGDLQSLPSYERKPRATHGGGGSCIMCRVHSVRFRVAQANQIPSARLAGDADARGIFAGQCRRHQWGYFLARFSCGSVHRPPEGAGDGDREGPFRGISSCSLIVIWL